MTRYKSIGLMSGSSLDGVDIAFCEFEVDKDDKGQLRVNDWQLVEAETCPFPEKWQARLARLEEQEALIFAKTHTYFGHFLGQLALEFINKRQLEPDFIASHGHTIFHDPDARLTVQIGDGAALAAVTGYPVICNFRSQDIAIDGEGAPVAPIVDQYLFLEYDFFLNIGGIANITFLQPDKTIAFDICPANQVLNALAHQLGLAYDDKGSLAAGGKLIPSLSKALQDIPFYQAPYPKSLDNQWSHQHVLSKMDIKPDLVPDQLHTQVEHIASQIGRSIEMIIQRENLTVQPRQLLVTGGGALNTYLIERLSHYVSEYQIKVVVPEADIVQFKEALLMAWMGVLRLENVPNVLKTVTGASRNTIGGAIYQGWKKTI